ncbi:MAG TPA: ATP synthase F0 subunit B [Bryobacteraceae bacterium]|nr:ATP synthase F0 subunit B [Bryobacteraceae bacterium]
MKRLIFLLLLSLCLTASAVAQEHQATAAPEHQAARGESHGEGGHGGGHSASNLGMWKWINFAILAGIIGYAFYKKGGAFFSGRTAEIRRDLDSSAKLREEAEARYADVERRLAKLGDEIAELKQRARTESEAEGHRLRQETERELAKIRSQAEQDIESTATAAQQDLRAYAASLAVALAERKIRERLTPETDAALVGGVAADIAQRSAREVRVS